MSAYVDSLLMNIAEHNTTIQDKQIMPVIHLIADNGTGTEVFAPPQGEEVIALLNDRYVPEFIAIPEREMGIGIIERAINARKFVRALGKSPCKLHALGCGNPLSVALLGVAGISMMDGLEWCRTVVAADNTHLHHFQQLELFEGGIDSIDPNAAWFYGQMKNYTLRTAIHNLVLFRLFIENLRKSIRNGSVEEFLVTRYGTGTIRALEAINRV